MSEMEWCREITRIDGNELRKWLETHTNATPKQIAVLVGHTGPKEKPKAGK